MGARDRLRVDAAEGALRALLPGHGHAGALRRRGHRVRGGRADEAHDRGAQQAGHALGAHRRDEPRRRQARQDLLQVQRRHRPLLPGLRLPRRGRGSGGAEEEEGRGEEGGGGERRRRRQVSRRRCRRQQVRRASARVSSSSCEFCARLHARLRDASRA